jgi:predicted nucleic acid-binding protein
MQAVLDASVAAKLFVREEGSELARTIAGAMDLFAPVLILAELANLLWKRLRRGDVTYDDAVRALDQFPAIAELADLDGLAQPAFDLSVRLSHPAYDCFYLALAQARKLPMITADRRLLTRVDALRRDDIQLLPLDHFAH